MMVLSLFIIDLMGLFFYNKIGSIISIGDLPTTNIIEPLFVKSSYWGMRNCIKDMLHKEELFTFKYFYTFYVFYCINYRKGI